MRQNLAPLFWIEFIAVCCAAGCPSRATPDPATEADISAKSVIVHHPVHVTDREAFEALQERAVVVQHVPQELKGLAEAFAAACRKTENESTPGLPFHILSTGPLLDGPDKVAVRRFILRGEQVELTLVHTSARLEGVQLFRNLRWRPMVQAPLDLPAGRYRLNVSWQAVKSLPDGPAWDRPPLAQSCTFLITPQK